mmetsp:Transcript_43629/g.170720  ORF Transcript_43629/g.170720 Transcript_43629/m.170720 type:complete len:274 (-) Transcript_43629:2547-3368(-)
MTEYRPFEESKGVFRSSRSRLRHNPFLLSKSGGDAKVRKRPRDGEQVGNKNSGDQLNRSAPAQKVTSILTLFDQPPVHSDVVYVLVDLVLRQDPSRLKGRNLEIESKLGIIYDKSSGSRVADDIPVCTNSALRSACHQDMRFSSTVNLQSFKTINEMLNRWVIKSPRRSEIECKHVTDVDTSYENGTRETKRVKPADGSRKWWINIAASLALPIQMSCTSQHGILIPTPYSSMKGTAKAAAPRSQRNLPAISIRPEIFAFFRGRNREIGVQQS